MLKYVSYDIVFQEIPDEVTLAINLSRCPNRCPGCHSPHLRDDIGDELSTERLAVLIDEYRNAATCVCFMGGDGDPAEVARLARIVKQTYGLKSGWYSGCNALPTDFATDAFDYVKVGGYDARCGDLKSPTTNQRLYRIANGQMHDITSRFWKR